MVDAGRIAERLARIHGVVADAAERARRDAAEITVVAAAKAQPADAIDAAIVAGVRAVGHNYVQELRSTRAALGEDRAEWHYIGDLRSGSAHLVADLSDIVETVGGERAARRLAGRAARRGRTIEVLLEVDLAGRGVGVPPEGVEMLAAVVEGLDGVRFRGLMTVPPIGTTEEDARGWFVRTRELRDRLRDRSGRPLDLSMGMSLDYAVAVEEGATMVRIGTALFGPRTP